MTTVLQVLNPSGTTSHFPNQKTGGVPTLTMLEIQARNLLTFLVVA